MAELGRRLLLSVAFLAASACTVAVDDYERCESATVPAELSNVCAPRVGPCINDCVAAGGTAEALSECVEVCTGAFGDCRECFFGEPTWCAARNECGDVYDNYICCLVGRCGSLDPECPLCFSEASEFGACVDMSNSPGGDCEFALNNCIMR